MNRFFSIVFLFTLTTGIQDTCAQNTKGSYSAASVLATGQWFKIAVTADGIYRIDFSKLKQLGLTTPANPRIYGNNFGQLSYYNNDPKPDDLKEISILLVKGADGVFNDGDYLLFFGMGTNKWKYKASTDEYNFVRHNYSDTAYYFLTSSPNSGKTIANAQDIPASPNYSSTDYDALYMHEVEEENIINSGREWYQKVSTLNGEIINPGFSDLILSEKMNYKIRVVARTTIPTVFRLYEGTTILAGLLVPEVNFFSTTGTQANIIEQSGSAFPASQSPAYEVKYYNNGDRLCKVKRKSHGKFYRKNFKIF
jgi:hypothetical protein